MTQSKILKLNVKSPELVAIIDVWDSFYVGESLTISGESSFDPDMEAPGDLLFYWECLDAFNDACVDVSNNSISIPSESKVNFAANYFYANATYTFQLTVSKDTRNSTTQKNIFAVSLKQPKVNVQSQLVNP